MLEGISPWSHFHGPISQKKKAFLRPLGPLDVLIFFKMSKMLFLEIAFMFNVIPFFFPSCFVNMETFGQIIINILKRHFITMVP